MNRVLILAEGKEAVKFISSIKENYLNVAEFDIIYNDSNIDNLTHCSISGLKFYKIQFATFVNLVYFKNRDYSKIIVVVKNKIYALNVLKALDYFIEKNIPIDFVDFWGLKEEFQNINIIKLPSIINGTLVDLLPNVPVFARSIGFGTELMQVEVPASSAFIYRNVELLNKENTSKWRIVAIYRNDKLLLPNKMTIIYPYDKLVIIGQSQILKDVFKTLKKDVGLFPEPYGSFIYVLIDKKNMTKKEASKLLKSAIFLQRKLKSKKLIVRIINPNLHVYRKLDKFSEIEVLVDYRNDDSIKVILNDFRRFRIGFFIINNKFYYKNIDFLLKLNKPFLKVGDKESIKECNSTGVILADNDAVKEISPVVFDVSSQLNYFINFFDIDPDNINLEKKEVLKYYENLSKMYYYRNIDFIIDNKNPYFELNKLNNVCFFVPFNKNIPRNKLVAYLFPSLNRVQVLLDKFNQIMIPTKN